MPKETREEQRARAKELDRIYAQENAKLRERVKREDAQSFGTKLMNAIFGADHA